MIRRLLGLSSRSVQGTVPFSAGVNNSSPLLSRREMLTLRRRKRPKDRMWRIAVDADRCSDCGACVRVCKDSAISRLEDKESVIYSFDATRCDGCGDCRAICAEDALRLERAEEAGRVLEAARLAIAACPCGKRAAGLADGFCPACRQRVSQLSGMGLMR